MEKIIRILLVVICFMLITACEEETINTKEVLKEPWWKSETPDVVLGDDSFYTGRCSITKVNNKHGKTIFEVPLSPLESCNTRSLTYDGEYIILDVCEMAFATGGCGGGRYRSSDLENWEEEIGVTWIKGEEYEAWRKLGSTSSKADSVKKVISEE